MYLYMEWTTCNSPGIQAVHYLSWYIHICPNTPSPTAPQTDLDSPLDLSGFACQHVAISFRVVSARNVSEFSPPAELCIGGGNDGVDTHVT